MELVLTVVNLAALVAIVFFGGYYATVRWERSQTGVSLMAATFATALIAAASLLRRWDELHPDVDWADDISPILIVAWLIVALVFAWRILALRKSKRGDDD